jgi:hypothetical protein
LINLIFQHNTFTRKLIQLLEIDDDSLLNLTPLATAPSADRYVALQQRQRTTEILIQKIQVKSLLNFIESLRNVLDVTRTFITKRRFTT